MQRPWTVPPWVYEAVSLTHFLNCSATLLVLSVAALILCVAILVDCCNNKR